MLARVAIPTISHRLLITLSPRRSAGVNRFVCALVVRRKDREDDLRRHCCRISSERALEDRLDILVISNKESRITEVDLVRFGCRELTY